MEYLNYAVRVRVVAADNVVGFEGFVEVAPAWQGRAEREGSLTKGFEVLDS